jgi:hypothetical protein
MSYAAFWIEILSLSMFFTALTMAVSARAKGLKSWLVLAPNAFVFFALCAPAAGAAFLKFKLDLPESYFAYATSLLAACVVGSIILQRAGAHRPAGISRASARWRIGPLAIGTLICLIVLVMTIWNMDLEARHRSEAVRARAGELLLSVAPPNVPDSQNAAILYASVFKTMSSDPLLHGSDSVLMLDFPPDPHDRRVAQALTTESANLGLLRDAASLKVCRFDHDYSAPSIEMRLIELNQMREAANVLRLDVAHELALGHAQRAMEDVSAIFAMSRATSQSPYLISGLVAIGIDSIGIQALEYAMPHVQVVADLAPLHVQDWETPSRIVQRTWRSEQACGMSMFADVGGGRRTLATLRSDSGPAKEVSIADRLEDLPFRLFLLDNEERGYERLMERYYEMMNLPYYQASVGLQSDDFGRIAHRGIMTAIVAPAYGRICLTTAKYEARHSAALVGIAIARYQFDHATLPDTLDALVPQYLAQIPTDPFDGHLLRYRKTSDDWRVYSIGPNNRDDGGTPYDPTTHSGNLSFVVKNR